MDSLYVRHCTKEYLWTRKGTVPEAWEEVKLTYEDQLPTMEPEDYKVWFKLSKVIEGVRMGPFVWQSDYTLLELETTKTAKELIALANPKPQMNLLIGKLLHGMVKVLMFGAEKYSPFGWMTVDDAKTRYFNSLRRHIDEMQMPDGSIDLTATDKESGLPHLWHIQANAYILEYHRKKLEVE